MERQTIVHPHLLPVWSCQPDYWLLRAHTGIRENIQTPHGSRNQSSDLLALMQQRQQLHYLSACDELHKKNKLKLLSYAWRVNKYDVANKTVIKHPYWDAVWHNTMLPIYSTAEQNYLLAARSHKVRPCGDTADSRWYQLPNDSVPQKWMCCVSTLNIMIWGFCYSFIYLYIYVECTERRTLYQEMLHSVIILCTQDFFHHVFI